MKIINANPGYGAALTKSEVEEFLLNNKLNLLLGTIDEKGDPNIHPVWYLYENGKLYVDTLKHSKKIKNIIQKDIVYFCIDDEKVPYKGVRGKGTAKIIDDETLYKKISEKIMIKYTGSLENELAKAYNESVKDEISILLEIMPKYLSTWDFAKK